VPDPRDLRGVRHSLTSYPDTADHSAGRWAVDGKAVRVTHPASSDRQAVPLLTVIDQHPGSRKPSAHHCWHVLPETWWCHVGDIGAECFYHLR